MYQNGPESSIAKMVGRRVLWRSLFLETLWNYEKKQNVGFSFCMYPVLEHFYPDVDERRRAVVRHLQPLNTHPSMGLPLAGVTARLELEMEPSEVVSYRKTVAGTLAAQGDSIFWGRVKPLSAAVAALLCVWFIGTLVGTLAFLILYNIPHLLVRITGFARGWREGLKVVQVFKSPGLDAARIWMGKALSLVLGLVAGSLVLHALTSAHVFLPSWTAVRLGVCLVVLGGLAFLLLRKEMYLTAVVYGVAVAAIMVFLLVDTGTGIR